MLKKWIKRLYMAVSCADELAHQMDRLLSLRKDGRDIPDSVWDDAEKYLGHYRMRNEQVDEFLVENIMGLVFDETENNYG